jgi:SAM-dependent methyltransferase
VSSNNNYSDKFYEQSDLWGRDISSEDEERIAETIQLIPNDVDEILDSGCGDGILTNRLTGKFKRIVGIDSSKEAIQHVKAQKICCSIDDIPFQDGEFDLTICAEVLEHLPEVIYVKTKAELQRVSNRYIIVSVPYNEQIEKNLLKCGNCGCIYHAWRHMRSFDMKTIESLFNHFKLEKVVFCGNLNRRHNIFLLRAKRLFGGGYISSPTAICPQCGSRQWVKSRNNIFTISLGLLNKIIPAKKTKRWVIALYKKQSLSPNTEKGSSGIVK